VIGPWHHGSFALLRASMREALRFLQEHLRGDSWPPVAPVRIRVGGSGQWRELPDWPPAHRVQEWFIGTDGGLAPHRRPDPGRREFRYDPAHPTPAVGGPRLNGAVAGVRDNRLLEARPDVLVYTSEPLSAPLEAIGPVCAVIRTTSSAPSFDVFVRVCDVAPNGRSENLCDGLVRVTGEPRAHHEVTVDLWPVAHVFRPGHRLRVQVSGGAHPRWARNPGTGAALSEAGPMLVSERAVLSGSVLRLPTATADLQS
jgi:putative CocE/NonD family hydrolase